MLQAPPDICSSVGTCYIWRTSISSHRSVGGFGSWHFLPSLRPSRGFAWSVALCGGLGLVWTLPENLDCLVYWNWLWRSRTAARGVTASSHSAAIQGPSEMAPVLGSSPPQAARGQFHNKTPDSTEYGLSFP